MRRRRDNAFTLVELLVIVAIVALLSAMLLPSLRISRQLAKGAACQANLHHLGQAMGLYQAMNRGYFWPYALQHHPTPGVRCYFWGTDADPVDPHPSPFLRYCEYQMGLLWCPSFVWGSYVPQGAHVREPTTTYGYNGRCLDEQLNGRSCRHAATIPDPGALFVFGDTAMAWSAGGGSLFQNSTYMEPVEGSWVQMPTNHFRHLGKTNALCADGHAEPFGTEGWEMNSPHGLGFVGTHNEPHYEQ